MDPRKPFIARGLLSPANTRLEAKDPSVEDSNIVSLQSSRSCDYLSRNSSSYDNGKQLQVYSESERNFDAVDEKKIKRRSLSLEPSHVSLELGLSLSGGSISMSTEEKKEIRFFEVGESGRSQYQRDNQHQILINPKIGGPSVELSLGFNDVFCSNKKKRPESESRVSSRRNKRTKVATEEIMTKLQLGPPRGYDPWCIKKTLCESDLGNLCRLMLPLEFVESHVFPFWNADQMAKIRDGLLVSVWDCDTKTEHELVFKRWKTGAHVLIKNWVDDFVKRRQLKKGDEVGLYWDESTSRFKFAILNRSVGPLSC